MHKNSVNSEHEAFLHPNMLGTSFDQSMHKSGRMSFKHWIRHIDEKYLKPFFIYNYQAVKKEKKEEFIKLITEKEIEIFDNQITSPN